MQIIAADGLSALAIEANLRDIYSIILDGIKAKVTLILIGERPGLATGESMSCYMAYEASSKKSESQRKVISNIHKNGTFPVEAGAQTLELPPPQ